MNSLVYKFYSIHQCTVFLQCFCENTRFKFVLMLENMPSTNQIYFSQISSEIIFYSK